MFTSLLFASLVSSAAIITTPTEEAPSNILYTISEPAVTSQPDISFSGGKVMANGMI